MGVYDARAGRVQHKMIKITFFNTYWPTNIGNAFIDLGSIQSIKVAAPDSSIYTVSGYPRILFERKLRSQMEKMLEKVYKNRAIKKLNRRTTYIKSKILKRNQILKEPNNSLENCFDLGRTVKSDYATFSGMILYDSFIKRYKSIILDLKKKNVRIIFNGVGGPSYSEGEIVRVRKFLKEISPYAFVSRDEKAFECYQDLAEYSYDGIDCGFFVNDYFTPPKLDLPEYVILNFDKLREPKFNITDKIVIRTHHWYSEEYGKIPRRYFTMPNTLISDSPDDYLALYSNTSAIFSDRVHACVVTLSYGRPAELFVGDDAEVLNRMSLFKRIGADSITNRLTYPDTERIEREKEKQVRFLYEILTHA